MSGGPLRWRNSIRAQLMLGFGVILLLHGLSAAIGYGSLQWLRHRSQTTLDNAAQLRELSLELNTNFLLARQAEETYFDTWQRGNGGTDERVYVQANQAYMAKARENLAALRQLEGQNPELAEEFALLASLFNNYDTAFATTTRRISDDSLNHELHQQLKDLLTTLTSPDNSLSPDMATLRMLVWQLMAQQQAYLNTQNPAYLSELHASLEQLAQSLDQLTAGALSAEARALMQTYRLSLNALLLLDRQVQVNRIIAGNVNRDINGIIETMGDRSAARATQARAELAKTANQSNGALLATALTALALASWASFVLGRRIITPLTLMAAAADRIARQDLSHPLTIAGDNEFSAVAQAFNNMVNQLQHTLANLEQQVDRRTEALATANQALQDQTQSLEVALEKIRHQALHDALTGLPNRTLFTERLDQAIEQAKRYPDQLFAVLFIDLDRFKVINDSLGHLVGDHLLMQIAHILQRHVRASDTVARLGGDEFVILLEHISGLHEAIQVVERIQDDIKSPFTLMGHTVFTTASLGIALSSPTYSRGEDMLRDADNAMYRAKAQGQASTYAIFNPAMHQSAIQLFELETSLRQALEHQEFILHYQPIVSLATRQLLGFEALVRWVHPQRGLVSPGEFIPLAEETGLIMLLSEWIIKEACRQMADWCHRLLSASGLKISINVAAAQFESPKFFEQINAVLGQTSLPATNLSLEVTESLLLTNVEGVLSTLSDLQLRGVEVSIDDFGTGYSSLSYLKQFPINTLKIDQSFVENIDVDHDDVSIVKAIVQIAQSLGMAVIAEGVETEFQFNRLEQLGCDAIQGYWIAPPLTADEAEAFIQERGRFQPISHNRAPGSPLESHQ